MNSHAICPVWSHSTKILFICPSFYFLSLSHSFASALLITTRSFSDSLSFFKSLSAYDPICLPYPGRSVQLANHGCRQYLGPESRFILFYVSVSGKTKITYKQRQKLRHLRVSRTEGPGFLLPLGCSPWRPYKTNI